MEPPAELLFFQRNTQLIRQELKKVFVGNDTLVQTMLGALIAEGHVLLESMPGQGKTLLAKSMARCFDLKFSRIQFTPDVMPMDITGGVQLQEDATGKTQLSFVPGPIQANFVLADEINRGTPKTQSALLEAMQERQLTVGKTTMTLPQPFFVIATQNPIEQEGTYPLPEAELDRFMVKLVLDYPSEADYGAILDMNLVLPSQTVQPVGDAALLSHLRNVVSRVILSECMKSKAIRLIMATQPHSGYATRSCHEYVQVGGGTRALQHLVWLAKVFALYDGRTALGIEDLQRAFLPVMRHRVILRLEATFKHLDADEVLTAIFHESMK